MVEPLLPYLVFRKQLIDPNYKQIVQMNTWLALEALDENGFCEAKNAFKLVKPRLEAMKSKYYREKLN